MIKYLAAFLMVFSQCFNFEARADGGSFHVNPESIRHQLLENNLSLEATFMQVQDAKDKVNLARANLLPSLNLGGMLNFSSGPSFVLSSVQFLLPFLLPSNWFNLSEEKNLFSAEKIAFRVLELNTFGSALSVYYTALNDQKVQAIYTQEAADYQEIVQVLQDQDQVFHNVPADQILQAKAQAQMAQSQSLGLATLSVQEISILRSALNLPLETELILDQTIASVSSEETASISDVVTKAQAIAPELMQIQYLIQAAEYAKKSTQFSFLGGATLGAQASPGSSSGVSSSNTRISGSLAIGAAIFPSIKLAGRNVEEVRFQDTQIRQQTTQVLEATLKSITNVQKQVSLTTQAENELNQVYVSKEFQYRQMHSATLTDVLLARTQMVAASAAKEQALLNLNLLRVTLQRSLLSDQFAKIKGCSMISTAKKQTLFQACRDAGTANLPDDMSAGMNPDSML